MSLVPLTLVECFSLFVNGSVVVLFVVVCGALFVVCCSLFGVCFLLIGVVRISRGLFVVVCCGVLSLVVIGCLLYVVC